MGINGAVFTTWRGVLGESENDIEIKYFVDSDGFYDFELKMKASRIKKVNFF